MANLSQIAARSSASAAFVCALCFIFLTGCAHLQAPPPPSDLAASVCQANAAEGSQPAKQADPNHPDDEIRIYQDATKSMLGFTAGHEPPYNKFLDAVHLAASETGSRHVSFWQFGTKVESLLPEKSKDPSTYQTRPGYLNNDYKVVFNETPKSALTVIVTDLFQSDNDIRGVTVDLQDQYFPDPKVDAKTDPKTKTDSKTPAVANAFAIYGTKLSFNGPIFDIGLSGDKIRSHDGQRPIYVLALGEKNRVARYLTKLKADLANAGMAADTNLLLLSPDPVTCLPAIDIPMTKGTVGHPESDTVSGLTISNMDVTSGLASPRHPLMKQFSVNGTAALVNLAVQVSPLSFLPLVNEDLIVRNFAEKVSDQSPTSFQPAPEAEDALHLKPFLQKEDPASANSGKTRLLTVNGDLQPQKLIAGQIYRFSVTVELDPDKNTLPAWVAQWSFSPPQQDGSKTENLSMFLNTLRSQMMSRATPVLLRAYFYVQKG